MNKIPSCSAWRPARPGAALFPERSPAGADAAEVLNVAQSQAENYLACLGQAQSHTPNVILDCAKLADTDFVLLYGRLIGTLAVGVVIDDWLSGTGEQCGGAV